MTNTIERVHGNSSPTHAAIWLHGLGATANDFVPVLPYLGLSDSCNIRFVFPQAPDRPITVNGGYVMPGWYDIKGMDITDKEDRAGMTESRFILEALIEEQIAKGIPSENILLIGFSQGGALAYYTGIRSQHKLAGILALSAYLPFLAEAKGEHSGVNINSPVMGMHGTADPVVSISAGKKSAEVLQTLGYQVQWQEYPMGHCVIPEQLTDIGSWINKICLVDK